MILIQTNVQNVSLVSPRLCDLCFYSEASRSSFGLKNNVTLKKGVFSFEDIHSRYEVDFWRFGRLEYPYMFTNTLFV